MAALPGGTPNEAQPNTPMAPAPKIDVGRSLSKKRTGVAGGLTARDQEGGMGGSSADNDADNKVLPVVATAGLSSRSSNNRGGQPSFCQSEVDDIKNIISNMETTGHTTDKDKIDYLLIHLNKVTPLD